MYQVQNWTREKKSFSEFEKVVVKRKVWFSCEKNFLMIFRESLNFKHFHAQKKRRIHDCQSGGLTLKREQINQLQITLTISNIMRSSNSITRVLSTLTVTNPPSQRVTLTAKFSKMWNFCKYHSFSRWNKSIFYYLINRSRMRRERIENRNKSICFERYTHFA